MKQSMVVMVSLVVFLVAVLPAEAQSKNGIPICEKSYGTLAIVNPDNGQSWWTDPELQLPPPTALMQALVMKSQCFQLVDRSNSLIDRERSDAKAGELRPGSNLGLAQKTTADYLMVPELIRRSNKGEAGTEGAITNDLIS